MPSTLTFVLDANVFIEAKKRYYAFDLAPKFWESLIQFSEDGQVQSLDRIKVELDRGKDDLTDWAAQHFNHAFAPTDEPPIIQRFGEIMVWAAGQNQYSDAAKAEFASIADGWLVAYARSTGRTLVTHEVPNGTIRRKVPIPNVCQAFNVPFVNTFEMLRQLGVRFS